MPGALSANLLLILLAGLTLAGCGGSGSAQSTAQEPRTLHNPPFWQAHPQHLLTHRQQFADGTFHHHRVGQVHQMDRHRLFLRPDGHVQHARAKHLHRRAFAGQPGDCVLQQLPMVQAQHFPEGAVNIPGEVNNLPGSKRTNKQGGPVSRQRVRFILFDLLWRSFGYVSQCVRMQMQAVRRAIEPELTDLGTARLRALV